MKRMDICKNCGNEIKPAFEAGFWHHVDAEPWSANGICGKPEPLGPLTDEDLAEVEANLAELDHANNEDVHRLIAEIRRQRAVLDQVDNVTQAIEQRLDHIVEDGWKRKPVAPSAIQRRIEVFNHVAQMIADGLNGKPFQWGDGQRVAWTPIAGAMGMTLVTRTHAERLGYQLKRRVKPIGRAYFGAPIQRTAPLYVLECQCVHVPMHAEEPAKE